MTFDLLTLKVHGVRVTCDVGYQCANFSLPRLLCSRLGPDVRDRRQTDRRQTASSLNASALWGGGIINDNVMTIYHKGRATDDMTCVACDVERPAWRTDDHEQQA